MLKVALTHDVDRVSKTYQYITYPMKSIIRRDIKNFIYHVGSIFKKNPYWCFPEIINIENEYGVKSTFYFLHETIPFKLFNLNNWKLSLGRYRIDKKEIISIIKSLNTSGWEIGLHGSYNSFKDIKTLHSEKKLLESIVGNKIIGIRQHYLNLNQSTWKIQKEIGFKYDTSFGYNDNIGYKDDILTPFKPFKDEFMVFPQVIMDSCFMATKNRKTKLLNLLDLTEKNDAVLVINWHHRSFNEMEFPGYKRAYCEIIEECKKRNAVFRTLGEYYTEIQKS